MNSDTIHKHTQSLLRRLEDGKLGILLVSSATLLTALVFFALPSLAAADTFTGSGGQALNASAGSDTSENWSGYSAAGTGTYSGVGGSWVVPQASETRYSADAAWVGLGGLSGTDLIQVGTQALADDTNTNGSAANFTYKAWYELLPSSPVDIPVSIKPGDSVTASITEQSSNNWLIQFQDQTTGQGYQTSVYYVSSMSAAEWIQEMPLSADTGLFVPLDNFGTVSFTNSWAMLNNSREDLQQLGATPMTMINYSNQALAIPSAIGVDGSSFSVNRTSAAVTSGSGVGSHAYSGGGSGTGQAWHRGQGTGLQGFTRGMRGSRRRMRGSGATSTAWSLNIGQVRQIQIPQGTFSQDGRTWTVQFSF